LLNKEIIVLVVRVLQQHSLAARLILNTLETLLKYLDYDLKMGLEEDASIKVYFMGLGGDSALTDLKLLNSFEIYRYVGLIIDKHFSDEDDLNEQDFLFS
jgi:hypothetical protein